MVKVKTAELGYVLLPEGHTEFQIIHVGYEEYKESGKLKIEMITSTGTKHTEQFNLIDDQNNLNLKALNGWKFWIGTITGIWNEQNVDYDVLEGKFFAADVTVEESKTINQRTGKPYQNNRLNNIETIKEFTKGEKQHEN